MIAYMSDRTLYYKWKDIEQHLITAPILVSVYNGLLRIETTAGICYIAKKSQKLRLKSYIDWVYYTPRTLAAAIDTNQLEYYNEAMMSHSNSDPNKWGDNVLEQELKAFYAARVNRASLI